METAKKAVTNSLCFIATLCSISKSIMKDGADFK